MVARKTGRVITHKVDMILMTKKCKNCGKKDTHFEGKFCSIECADIYDGTATETKMIDSSDAVKALMGWRP